MPLIRGDRPALDDWRRLPDEAPIPAGGRLILNLKRLDDEAEHLFHRPRGLGVELLPAEPVERLVRWLDRLELVALRFPSFADGRAFSAARLLRERWGFRGELRATGNVLVDQHQFMLQCGFDSFEVEEGRAWASWQKARVRMDLAYAPGYGERATQPALSILEARHRARLAVAAE
jgi:uncharacterized protein (DUF934 family)